jgi:hypothetical protein
VPRSTLPAVCTAPAFASSASARVVLPLPACPTSAIVLMWLMEFATGLPSFNFLLYSRKIREPQTGTT